MLPPSSFPSGMPGLRIESVSMASVLVIDDERLIRDMIKDAFEAEGHQVSTAEDGHAGLVAFQELRPEVVWASPRGVEGSVKNPSTPGGRNGTQTTPETVYP